LGFISRLNHPRGLSLSFENSAVGVVIGGSAAWFFVSDRGKQIAYRIFDPTKANEASARDPRATPARSRMTAAKAAKSRSLSSAFTA